MTSQIQFEFPTKEQRVIIRQQLGTSEGDIRLAVENIRSWLQGQPHLPNAIDDGRLERMYICCKCSTEKVKKLLDNYYTLKSKFPELLMNRDPLSPTDQAILKFVKLLTMPRITSDYHRVGVLTGIQEDASNLDTMLLVRVTLMAIEFVLSYDYSIGYIFIVDLENLTAAHITKLSVRYIRALELISRRAYSKRVVAIHFVNAPKVMDMLLSVVKPALPEKVQKRIMVHLPDTDTLFDHVPRDLVPNEMGGTGGPLEQLVAAVVDELVARRDWFLEQDSYVVDESQRPPGSHDDYEMFGVDGSFKKLQVD